MHKEEGFRMGYEVKLVEVDEQPVACVRARSSQPGLPNVIGLAYHEIMEYLTAQGVQPVYAPYTAYYNMDMKDLDVEMGFHIAATVEGKGRIHFRTMPAGWQIEVMYKGPYSGLIEPYNALQGWLDDNRYERCGPAFEYYFTGPEVPENEHITKIVIPVRKK